MALEEFPEWYDFVSVADRMTTDVVMILSSPEKFSTWSMRTNRPDSANNGPRVSKSMSMSERKSGAPTARAAFSGIARPLVDDARARALVLGVCNANCQYSRCDGTSNG